MTWRVKILWSLSVIAWVLIGMEFMYAKKYAVPPKPEHNMKPPGTAHAAGSAPKPTDISPSTTTSGAKLAGSSEKVKPRDREQFHITLRSYCTCTVCCGPKADGCVAWGGREVQVAPVPDMFVAISRDLERLLPFGTKLYIPGLGDFLVADRTHKDKNGQIEVLYTWWVEGYPDFHSAAHNQPSAKVLLKEMDGYWMIDSTDGEPLPWELPPWNLETRE